MTESGADPAFALRVEPQERLAAPRINRGESFPVRVQLRRTKGWRMPANTAKVDRTTRYGNDFIMAHEGTRHLAIATFRQMAEAQMKYCPEFYAPLRGKNLACWCPIDKPCHADVLIELVNAPLSPGLKPLVETPSRLDAVGTKAGLASESGS